MPTNSKHETTVKKAILPAPKREVLHKSEAPAESVAPEIPAEGNNIASLEDRAFADTPPANDQPPVEKTFVSS